MKTNTDGQESSFDSAFLIRLEIKCLKLSFWHFSNSDILDAKTRGYEVDVIEGKDLKDIME